FTFEDIEADSPESAATIAGDRRTAEADDIQTRNGEILAAEIDVAGSGEFEQSITIDFEAERLRKAAPNLLTALEALLTAADDLDAAIDGTTDQFDDERAGLDGASRFARAVIATG